MMRGSTIFDEWVKSFSISCWGLQESITVGKRVWGADHKCNITNCEKRRKRVKELPEGSPFPLPSEFDDIRQQARM
jgi:hypothetical protein